MKDIACFPFLADFVFLYFVVFPVYLRAWDYPILIFLGRWADMLEIFHSAVIPAMLQAQK